MTVDSLIGGRYRLDEQVGAGGTGVVWRAVDELLGRRVAIKHIRLDRIDLDRIDGEPAEIIRRRTLRKARLAARLRHPHIVSILDVLTVAGDIWLVLEYLPSERLSDVIARGTLTPWQAAGIGAGIADALAVAHAAGILHCDVKPGNVLLSRTGEVKLTDFGISRAADAATLTEPGLITGSSACLAPEVCRGEQPGTAADVYSLGAILYAAVEGTPPFGDGHGDTRRLTRPIGSGQVLAPKRAGPLTPVLHSLLSSDPAARPNALATRELLRQVAHGATAPPPPVGPVHPGLIPPPSRPRRRGWLVAGAVTGVLAITVALAIGLGRNRGSTPVPQAPPPTATTTPLSGPIPGVDGSSADTCAIAETATQTALTKLTTTGIGQRPAPTTGSLALLDACALLDPTALTVAGVVPSDPTPATRTWLNALVVAVTGTRDDR